ncbi:MAG: hypothetical protein M1818_001246 [Claussenomyces sp. TS43310]|nr:MAG: hypothetical protein M1818_001246 [Claussenomyces sp. TS43310]
MASADEGTPYETEHSDDESEEPVKELLNGEENDPIIPTVQEIDITFHQEADTWSDYVHLAESSKLPAVTLDDFSVLHSVPPLPQNFCGNTKSPDTEYGTSHVLSWMKTWLKPEVMIPIKLSIITQIGCLSISAAPEKRCGSRYQNGLVAQYLQSPPFIISGMMRGRQIIPMV